MRWKWKRGQIARCVEDGREANDYGLTVGQEYVVIAVKRAHDTDYLKVCGDDDRISSLLHSMFEPVTWEPFVSAKAPSQDMAK